RRRRPEGPRGTDQRAFTLLLKGDAGRTTPPKRSPARGGPGSVWFRCQTNQERLLGRSTAEPRRVQPGGLGNRPTRPPDRTGSPARAARRAASFPRPRVSLIHLRKRFTMDVVHLGSC